MKELFKLLFVVQLSVNGQVGNLGYVTPESEGGLQKCFNSDVTCRLTKAIYEIDTTLVLGKSKIIEGNNATIKMLRNRDVIAVQKDIGLKETTKNILIRDLIIDTRTLNHDRAGIRFDVNSRIMDVVLNRILFKGNKELLSVPGMGTKAIWIGSDQLSDYDPFLHNLSMYDIKTEYCAEGIYIPHNGSLWVNTITASNFITWGNKRAIFNEIADIMKIDIKMHFDDVLPKEEKDFAAITLKDYARNSHIEFMAFDTQRKKGDKYFRPKLSSVNNNYKKLRRGKTIKTSSKNRLKNIYKE